MIIDVIGSGIARGASGSTRPEAQALGAHQHTFCKHLKRVLSRNFDQSMFKNAYFLNSASGAPSPNPRLLPAALRPQTPALLLSPTITSLSSSFLALNAFYYPKKRIEITTAVMLCFCFLRSFAPIFHFKLCSFCWQGAQDYSLPQGAGYPSYATGHR